MIPHIVGAYIVGKMLLGSNSVGRTTQEERKARIRFFRDHRAELMDNFPKPDSAKERLAQAGALMRFKTQVSKVGSDTDEAAKVAIGMYKVKMGPKANPETIEALKELGKIDSMMKADRQP